MNSTLQTLQQIADGLPVEICEALSIGQYEGARGESARTAALTALLMAGATPVGAATEAKQDSEITLLTDILAELKDDKGITETLQIDPTTGQLVVRQTLVNQDTGAITTSYQLPDGTAYSGVVNDLILARTSPDYELSESSGCFTSNATEYSVGDLFTEVRLFTTDPFDWVSQVVYNLTTGLVVTAPADMQYDSKALLQSVRDKLDDLATAALQTTGNAWLADLSSQMNFAATSSKQTDGNALLTSIDAKLTDVSTAAKQDDALNALQNILVLQTTENARSYIGDSGAFIGYLVNDNNGNPLAFSVLNGNAPSSVNAVAYSKFPYSFTSITQAGEKLQDFISNVANGYFNPMKVLSFSILNEDAANDCVFAIRGMPSTTLKAGRLRNISWGDGQDYSINEKFFNDFVFDSNAEVTVSWEQGEI